MENPALSTKAIKLKYDENRYRYNGIEYDSAFGINEFEAHFRDLDPALGRWTTIDPKIEDNQESMSPYVSMNNDPCRISDPLGDEGGIGDAIMASVRWINSNLNPLTPIVEVVTGKSVESDLTVDKSRVTAAVEGAMFLAPEIKAEGVIAKVTVEGATKATEQVVAKSAIKASNGVEVEGFTSHAVIRAIQRGVKPTAIKDALKNTLKTGKVVTDNLGRQSQRFVGKSAEVVVNPETKKIISVNPTSTRKAAKLIKQLGGN